MVLWLLCFPLRPTKSSSILVGEGSTTDSSVGTQSGFRLLFPPLLSVSEAAIYWLSRGESTPSLCRQLLKWKPFPILYRSQSPQSARLSGLSGSVYKDSLFPPCLPLTWRYVMPRPNSYLLGHWCTDDRYHIPDSILAIFPESPVSWIRGLTAFFFVIAFSTVIWVSQGRQECIEESGTGLTVAEWLVLTVSLLVV